MKKLGLGIAALTAVFMTSNAQAATIVGPIAVTVVDPGFSASLSGTNTIDATFDGTIDGDAAGTITFTVASGTGTFDLVLASYESDQVSGSSGFGLTDNFGISQVNGPSTVTCASSAFGGTACYRIGDVDDTNPTTIFPGSTLFSSLTAGTYEFAFWEGNSDPISGTFSLQVQAVPVPAAGVLFGSAMLGAAFLRRRKLQSQLGLPS